MKPNCSASIFSAKCRRIESPLYRDGALPSFIGNAPLFLSVRNTMPGIFRADPSVTDVRRRNTCGKSQNRVDVIPARRATEGIGAVPPAGIPTARWAVNRHPDSPATTPGPSLPFPYKAPPRLGRGGALRCFDGIRRMPSLSQGAVRPLVILEVRRNLRYCCNLSGFSTVPACFGVSARGVVT